MDINDEPTSKDLYVDSVIKEMNLSDEQKCIKDVQTCNINKNPPLTNGCGGNLNGKDSALTKENEIITSDKKSDLKKMTSEYIMRASTMRSKIEEKITEIEKKMGISQMEFSTETDSLSSPTDYNTIKVRDVRRCRSCSVSEMRQSTIERLQSKLEKAEKDLELREEEVAKLRKIRDEVGSEIEDLTASLFEEANNMVKKAHSKQQKAEKNAKEINMKLAMLQEEVRALKNIVQSTKIDSPSVEMNLAAEKKAVSHQREPYEVDPTFNSEFVTWRQNPNFNKEDPFLKRIYDEDILYCLSFKNTELSAAVLTAIESDKITIEKLHGSKCEPLPKFCALLNAPRLCPYKMYLGDNESYNISTLSRNRITAVCDLFCYLRYIQKGLISLSIHEVYLEVLKKRRQIVSAKLGLLDDIVE